MLIGNLGADPEVRSTNNGSRVATLSLATSRQWTGQGRTGAPRPRRRWPPRAKRSRSTSSRRRWMRRTTICRSNRGAVLALAAMPLLIGVLRAQDTTHVDTTRAQDTTHAAATQLGQLPATHTVSRGETLWSISQLYFADPLLWPEIYRLNTSVVEDPHWIYPGEVLTFAGEAPTDTATTVAQGKADSVKADTTKADTTKADTVVAAGLPPDTTQPAPVEPPPPPPPTAEAYQTIFDRTRTRTEQVRDVLRAYANQPYRPVRRGEFYSAGWLTEQERLPWAAVLGTTSKPAIHRLSERTTAMQFEEIAIAPSGKASYHVGDSLLLARISAQVPGWGDGVVPGDVFEVYQPATGELGSRSEEVRLQLMIVHTREHSASGLVIQVTHPDVAPGMAVRLVKKMPS